MNENRKLIENRIFQLINYINYDKLLISLKQNIKFFSINELLLIEKFLETWDFNNIFIFLNEKYKEYLWIIEEIKDIKIKILLNDKKNKEIEEKIEDEYNLDILINF